MGMRVGVCMVFRFLAASCAVASPPLTTTVMEVGQMYSMLGCHSSRVWPQSRSAPGVKGVSGLNG